MTRYALRHDASVKSYHVVDDAGRVVLRFPYGWTRNGEPPEHPRIKARRDALAAMDAYNRGEDPYPDTRGVEFNIE